VHAADINEAIIDASRELEACACVSAHHLGHKGDRLHFDTPSLVELGKRYAASWTSLYTGPGGSDKSRGPLRSKHETGGHSPALAFPRIGSAGSTDNDNSKAVLD
jgi:hypothetical protein